jgi:hypothetical protein
MESRIWRCPDCGTTLIVIEVKGRSTVFRYRGSVVRVCPSCKGQTRHKPRLARVYAAAQR